MEKRRTHYVEFVDFLVVGVLNKLRFPAKLLLRMWAKLVLFINRYLLLALSRAGREYALLTLARASLAV